MDKKKHTRAPKAATPTHNPNWGGRRKNQAGRPRIVPGENSVLLSIRVTPSQLAQIRRRFPTSTDLRTFLLNLPESAE